MTPTFAIFKDSLEKIQDKATERSYYRHLCNFIDEYSASLGYKDIYSTSEESSKVNENSVGFPDITIRDKKRLIGWIEVKLPIDQLTSEKFQNQFKKYQDSLENIIFTNLKDWQLWQWDADNNPKKVSEITFDPTNFAIGAEKQFEDFFQRFIEGVAYEVKTPKQLALALAKKTRFLSKQVEEAYTPDDVDSELCKLKNAFEKTLIQNISDHQFSNMVAETLSYSIFLSSLEHYKRNPEREFTLRTAIDYLPTNIPVLSDLYSLVERVTSSHPNILHASQLLIDQINNSNIERIYYKLVEHKPGEDPVIQFYEPFLAEYDPKEREARGVYYTPKPVVDYIVRSVDYILKEKFGKREGLADPSVNILDPATGTGTFLMSAIQEIHNNIAKDYKPLGEEMVQKKFSDIVINHILKHFYGFELMVAPYAVAHLKLTLLLEEYGFNFANTKNDDDSDNDRFKVYLANTLDDPNNPPQLDLPGFHSISEETKKANKIKNEVPILAIIGNPPYSLVSSNLQPSMRRLIEKYKYIDDQKIQERGALQMEKILNDDYVKFISFAQEKIDTCGEGVLAFVNNHTFLDNPTMRGMRNNLIHDFDEIYIFNLHGNYKQRITNIVDENVFGIQQGVSINIFVKRKNKEDKDTAAAEAFYFEQKGTKLEKFNTLNLNKIDTIPYKKITPASPNFYLIPRSEEMDDEYSNFLEITRAFPLKSIGFFTSRDSMTIGYSRSEIEDKINYFKSSNDSNEDLCHILGIPVKKGWNISRARKLLQEEKNIEENYVSFLHRPFDKKVVFYHRSLVWSMSQPVMRNILKRKNLSLCMSRQLACLPWRHCLVSNDIVELCYLTNKTKEGNHVFPLYIYPNSESDQNSFIHTKERIPNLNPQVIKEISEKIKLDFISDGKGDLHQTFGPEDVFYYIYSTFHSAGFRKRYAEQLKIDFPRIPITSDKNLFKKIVNKGRDLVNLHLLGDNPFDNSETIISHPEKWNIKIGGHKPEGLPDWKVSEVRYSPIDKRVYVNQGQYFEGVEKEVWEFIVGGYQVCDKWLKDRKKAGRCLSANDLTHYMKIVVVLRETIQIMKEIDELIPEWPLR